MDLHFKYNKGVGVRLMLCALDGSLHDCYLVAVDVNVLRSALCVWITLDYITKQIHQ